MDGGEAEPKHSSAPEGKAISAAAVKNQYLLINFRRLARLVKSRWCDVCVGTRPPSRSTLLRKEKKNNDKQGTDGGRVECWSAAKTWSRNWKRAAAGVEEGGGRGATEVFGKSAL